MAILNNLIVHGASRFLGDIYTNFIKANKIEAEEGAFQKLTAINSTLTNATVVGLLDVTGELHTKSFTNSNIATIDGSFYITPTLGLQGGNSTTNTVTITANSLSFSHSGGTNFNFESLYINSGASTDTTINWTTGSSVIVTGEILSINEEWMPLGTLKGTLSTYTSTSVIINNLKDSSNNTAPATLAALAGQSGRKYRNIKISLVSINNSGLKPLGIYMTAAGSNGKTFLDIYGGNNAESSTYAGLSSPVVRIGNLHGLPAIQGVNPAGWGIYTTNGFFSGMVAADRGKIGGWNIGTDTNKSLYTGTFNSSGGVYISPSYSGTLSVVSGTKNWAFTAGDTFGVTTAGVLYASGAQLKTLSIRDSNNKIRAVVDTNGLTIQDASEAPIANFNSSVTLGPTFTINNLGAFNTTINSSSMSMSQNGVGSVFSFVANTSYYDLDGNLKTKAPVALFGQEYSVVEGNGVSKAFLRITPTDLGYFTTATPSSQFNYPIFTLDAINKRIRFYNGTGHGVLADFSSSGIILKDNNDIPKVNIDTNGVSLNYGYDNNNNLVKAVNISNGGIELKQDTGQTRALIDTNGLSIKDINGTTTIANFGKINPNSENPTVTIGKVAQDDYNIWMLPQGMYIRNNLVPVHFLGDRGLFLNQYTSITPGNLELANSYGDTFVQLYSPGTKIVSQKQTFQGVGGNDIFHYILAESPKSYPNITNVNFTIANPASGITYTLENHNTANSVAPIDGEGFPQSIYTVAYDVNPPIDTSNEITFTYDITVPKTKFVLGHMLSDRIELTDDGLSLYSATDVSNPVVSLGFGEIRLGKTSAVHTIIDENGMRIYGGYNNALIAHMGFTNSYMRYYTFGERKDNSAIGNYSHAEGRDVIASGSCSHAEGYNTAATDTGAHAEGHYTSATGYGSHAEGFTNFSTSGRTEGIVANNYGAHAEGYAANSYSITATGLGAHVEGNAAIGNTIASGDGSHAEGSGTEAAGNYSHAQNKCTKVSYEAQTAIGKYNSNQSANALEIGNGTANNARSNALTVDWNGNVNIASGAKYKINGTNLAASDVGAVPTIGGTITKTSSSPTVNALVINNGTSNTLTVDWSGNTEQQGRATTRDMTTGTNSELEDFLSDLDISGSGLETTQADWIVGQGTNGIWTWRKWQSGIAECWGDTGEITLTNYTTAGTFLYGYQTSVQFPTNLFVSKPFLRLTLYSGIFVNNRALSGSFNFKIVSNLLSEA